MVLNVYATTPAAGNYVTTYPWSGGNSTQVFERYGFTSSGGYSGTYIYPYGYPGVALNYHRSGTNPRVTLGNVIGNYAGDIDVSFRSNRFQMPSISQHNYNQYMLEDASIGTAAAQSGKYLIWARYSYTTFNAVDF